MLQTRSRHCLDLRAELRRRPLQGQAAREVWSCFVWNKIIHSLHCITSWLSLQARTSETQQEQQRQKRSSKEVKQDQHTAKWDFRVMTYNILAEGLVRLLTGSAPHA